MDGYLGFIEFFIVAMFALAWGVLEIVGRRLDKKRTGDATAKSDRPAEKNKHSD